jgi:glutaredoxin
MTVSVTFYTRTNCSLCDKAKASIRASGVAVRMTEIDIDTDDLLRDLYNDHVPVILVEGIEAFRHFVQPEEFAEYVRAYRASLPRG